MEELKDINPNLEEKSTMPSKTHSESDVLNADDDISIQQEPQHRILVMAPATEARDRLTALLERENNAVSEYDTTSNILSYLEGLKQPEEIQLVNMLIVDWSLSDTVLKKLVRHLQQAPFSQIPVIALTESPCIEINEAMMFLKHTAVLQKPIKMNDLQNVLQRLLIQPSLNTSNRVRESDYYSFLESNTLLEHAIKNHNNSERDTASSTTDSLN